MKEEIKTVEKPILEKIADKLLKAQQEIDELVVQFALGKAEGKEKFEEIKRDFRNKVIEFKKLMETTALNILNPETMQRLTELELQLALGKAESRELFEEQKKKIMKALDELETVIKPLIASAKLPDSFSHDVEKFKLKLEIIRLKFQLKKFEIKDAFKDNMAEARRKIEKINTGIRQKMETGSLKYSDFRDEMSIAYKHLKKALTDL